MAEERKDTKKKDGEAKKTAARRKPAAKKPAAAKPKRETATRGKGAAEATSKTADSKAAEASTKKAPAKPKSGAKSKSETKPKAPAKPKGEAKPKAEAKSKPKPEEEPQRPVVNARARYVRVAPRKARMVADQVRGLPIDDARALLRFSTRSAAQDIRKVIDSAAANAEANHDLVADDLLIKDIHVDEGPTLRRYRPRALGRATRINKRTSHIAVALTPED